MNLLLELVNSFINSLSTREMALIILLFAIFLILVFFNKSVRSLIPEIIKLFFSIKLFIVMILYIALILFILYIMGILNILLTKDVIFWLILVPIPLLYAASKFKDEKNFFRNKAIGYISLTTFFGFIINFYTFNVFVEIIFLIILFLLIALISVSKTDEKYKPVENFFNILLLIIIFYLVIFFIYNLLINPNDFININTLITYILPSLLTALFLPFVYIFALYMRYETFCVFLKVKYNNPKLRKYVFKEVFKRYNLKLYKFNEFFSEFGCFNAENIEDVEKEIILAEKRAKSRHESDE